MYPAMCQGYIPIFILSIEPTGDTQGILGWREEDPGASPTGDPATHAPGRTAGPEGTALLRGGPQLATSVGQAPLGTSQGGTHKEKYMTSVGRNHKDHDIGLLT